ncbi:TIM barrel protein [Aestuariivirga litoralis]|uniref:TIM barrel protein n=1 Tax=Aestuariivirga litoralis TaxID=2650924 RepID=UPI0018C72F32|nr:TIM barrel protein [Aestuariivirga litoralis]MBG1233497.1 TIM barrel protein [Aestuariivirga litoralis]
MSASTHIKFAINRMVAPRLSLDAFLALAGNVGAEGVEIRNDVEGQEFADGMKASELCRKIADAGLSVASINALQRFNEWTPERESEAKFLFSYAAELGAPGIVMCPVVDEAHGLNKPELSHKLREALHAIKKIATDTGVIGYVEPLGMKGSTLNSQQVAAEAICEVDGQGALQICFDTFQHFRASDGPWVPELTGLVHISGITRDDLAPFDLSEPDRVFVDVADRCGNLEMLKAFYSAGYAGFVSMEPFSPAIHAAADVTDPLRSSFNYIRSHL